MVKTKYLLVNVNNDEDFSSGFNSLESYFDFVKPVYDFNLKTPIKKLSGDFFEWFSHFDSLINQINIDDLRSKIDLSDDINYKLIGVGVIDSPIFNECSLGFTYPLGANSHIYSGSLILINTGVLSKFLEFNNYSSRTSKVIIHEFMEDFFGINGVYDPHDFISHYTKPANWVSDESFCVNDYSNNNILLINDKLKRSIFSVDYKSDRLCDCCLSKFSELS